MKIHGELHGELHGEPVGAVCVLPAARMLFLPAGVSALGPCCLGVALVACRICRMKFLRVELQ